MKLQSKKSKTLTIVGIVVAAVVLIGLIIGAIFLFGGDGPVVEPNPTDIVGITMSGFPNREYVVDDEFDPSGAKIQVLTHDMKYTRFVDHTQLSFSGFDSTAAVDEQVITVSYRGFTTSFTVKISERPSATPVAEGIEVFGFKDTYDKETWMFADYVVDGATLKVVYSDGSMSEEIRISPEWMYGWKSNQQPGEIDLTIRYLHEESGTVFEKIITVTLTD